MTDYKQKANTITSLMTTELNSLANNYAALGVEFDNAAGLWINGDFELTVTFGSNPTAGNTCDLYLVQSHDGTNYSDYTSGASGYAPATCLVGSFPLQAKTTIHRLTLQLGVGGALLRLPPTKFKALLINKSGVAFPSSGSTLKLTASMYQGA